MRFVKEYKNYQVKQIEANDLMNEGIKAEIFRRISRVYEAWEKDLLTTDELMESLSRRCMEDGEDMSRYYTEAKPEAAKQTEAEQTASTWMDYDSIIDYWCEYTGAMRVSNYNSEKVILEDYCDTWVYKNEKEAALDCLESIKAWAEDDDEAMQFVKEITNGEITEADIRPWANEAEKQTPAIESVEPCYTGGGVYIFTGKLIAGDWFMAVSDGCFSVRIINADPSEDEEESQYAEWQEEHLVKDLDEAEAQDFFKQMLTWINVNVPEGNYIMSDMNQIEEDLNESMNE